MVEGNPTGCPNTQRGEVGRRAGSIAAVDKLLADGRRNRLRASSSEPIDPGVSSEGGNLGARGFGERRATEQRGDGGDVDRGVQGEKCFAAVGVGPPAKPEAKDENENDDEEDCRKHIPTRRRRPPGDWRRGDNVVETIKTGSVFVHDSVPSSSFSSSSLVLESIAEKFEDENEDKGRGGVQARLFIPFVLR
jgi:hypothetical protein